MSNAERQKAYRDRQRGGPPVKRLSMADFAKMQEIGLTYLKYSTWISRHRPDLAVEVEAGRLSAAKAYEIGRTQAGMEAMRIADEEAATLDA